MTVEFLGTIAFAMLFVLGLGPRLWGQRPRPAPSRARGLSQVLIGELALVAVAGALDVGGDRGGLRALTAPLTGEVVIWTALSALTALPAALIGPTPQDRVPYTAAAAAGIAEEYAFRGYFLALMRAVTKSAPAAIALTSLCFALLQRPRGPFAIWRAAMLSLVFAVAVIASGSLAPAIVGRLAGGAITVLRQARDRTVASDAVTTDRGR